MPFKLFISRVFLTNRQITKNSLLVNWLFGIELHISLKNTMDSITLNITTKPQPLRSLTAVKPDNVRSAPKRKSQHNSSNEFTFEFGGRAPKVKAFVARKRLPAKIAASKQIAEAIKPRLRQSAVQHHRNSTPAHTGNTSSECNDKAASASARSQLTNASETTSKSANTEEPSKPIKALTKVAEQETMAAAIVKDDIALNIYTNPDVLPKTPKPKPRTRHERLNEKRALRRSTAGTLLKRTLTQQEIDKGIRKFSTNPNRKTHRTANEDVCKTKQTLLKTESTATEPQLGGDSISAHPKTHYTNRFRMKRPEDSSVKKIDLFTNNAETKIVGQRLVKPITERIFAGIKVASLDLHPHCVKNLADILSITELTTVQQKTIPKALEGKDILVRSQTGSGKTLAYALPIVEKLQAIRPKINRTAGILAIIIVPTRELAIQTYELFLKLLKPFTWIVAGVLMGGERRKAEKARLRKGINVLVGTPGRLVDHLLHTETFKLSKSQFLVLDEADRLLDMGYECDVKQIVEAIDKQRAEYVEEQQGEQIVRLQRLLLSATLTAAVQKLAGLTLKEPIFIDNSDEVALTARARSVGYNKEEIEQQSVTVQASALAQLAQDNCILTIPENLELSYVLVPPKLRLVTISGLLAHNFSAAQRLKAIVFMSTMEMVNFHHDILNEQLTRKVLDEDDDDEETMLEMEDEDTMLARLKRANNGQAPLLEGLRFFRLHGSMTQTERQGVFKGFRNCKSGILLATDVFERGIDVAEIDLVIQYSPPQTVSDFVHRVGRTARAGRSGRAILFLTPNESQFVRILEDKRIRITQTDMNIYLNALFDADNEAHTIQEAASNLQYKFQELITDDKEMYDKACKAFVSCMKFYATFPKELKPIFNIKTAHMGHFAKSFGLQKEPSAFASKHSMPKPPPPTNRLTYTERDTEKIKQEKRSKRRLYATTVSGEKRNLNSQQPGLTNKFWRMLNISMALNTSEFDSGIVTNMKKKKTK